MDPLGIALLVSAIGVTVTAIVSYVMFVRVSRGMSETVTAVLAWTLAGFFASLPPLVYCLAFYYARRSAEAVLVLIAIAAIIASGFVGEYFAEKRYGRRGGPQSPDVVGWPEPPTPTTTVFQSVWITSDAHLRAMRDKGGLSTLYSPGAYPQMSTGLGLWAPLPSFSRGRIAVDEHGLRFEATPQRRTIVLRLRHMRDDLRFDFGPEEVVRVDEFTDSGACWTRIRSSKAGELSDIIVYVGEFGWSRRVSRTQNGALLQTLRAAFSHRSTVADKPRTELGHT